MADKPKNQMTVSELARLGGKAMQAKYPPGHPYWKELGKKGGRPKKNKDGKKT